MSLALQASRMGLVAHGMAGFDYDKARQALTVKAAKALYHQAQTIVINERPLLVLWHAIKYAGVSNRVTGVQFLADIMLRVAFAQFK